MAKFDKVIVAEKPSLAQNIAEALAALQSTTATKSDGYWAVGNDVVTWLYGHMAELAGPKDYGERWANWTISSLPIVIVDDSQWKLVIPDDKKSQTGKVEALVRQATVIVGAGDAGREGQLLVDELFVKWGIDAFAPNVKRLWVQSMARKDMMAALSALIPNADKRGLYDSAVCRQRADWQHGMTFSRLYTLLARNSGTDAKISVGRVQTPTLRLVVDRDRERAKFKAVDHFLPRIAFKHPNGTFNATWVIPQDYEGVDSSGRLVDKKVADAFLSRIRGKDGKIRAFKAETKFVVPPLPYSLSALQAECGSKLGLTAKQTLDTAQSLYEKHKATSYPRSDSRYLPTNILSDEAPAIMRALSVTPGLEAIASGADMAIRTAAWDDSKISDHYGIIPTMEFSAAKLARMDDTERKVFLMIAKAFMSQFYAAFKYRALGADVACEGEMFKATGRQIMDQGWKTVYGAEELDEDDDKDEEAAQSLPTMAQGDTVEAVGGDISSKRTSPPPAFNDGTLITAMANVHRFVTNPEMKKRLKESAGIGTEATRADTIETLVKRGYVKREGKNTLKSATFGQSIIDVLPEELKDPGLTAYWEGALQQVEAGKLTPAKFMEAQVKSITDRVDAARGTTIEVRGVASSVKPLEGHGKDCPLCKKGKMFTKEITSKKDQKKYIFLACSNQPDCNHSEWPKANVPPLPGQGNACTACGKGTMDTKEITSSKDQKKYRLLECTNRKGEPPCANKIWEPRDNKSTAAAAPAGRASRR